MSYPVLTLQGDPVSTLMVGQTVLVMSIIGRVQATVSLIEREPTPEPQTWYETKREGEVRRAYAEDEGNTYLLEIEEGKWVGNSQYNKRALAKFMEGFR